MNEKQTSRLYWILQASGWSLYGVIGIITNFMFNGVSFKTALFAMIGASLLLVLSHFLKLHAKKHQWTLLHPVKLFLRVFFSTLLLAVFSQSVMSVLLVWVFDMLGDQPYSFGVLLMYIFQTQVILVCWSLIYFVYHALKNYKQAEIEKWRLEAAVKDAELIALKAQINPHFLFNCLNNIRALVLEDPKRSRDMITKMSDLLRYSIRFNRVETVTISEEIEIVEDYLSLQAIQYEERLNYQIEVSDSVRNVHIPPMVIQLLVENAIKHGIEKNRNGGSIDVQISSDHADVIVQVINTGQVIQKTESLQNTGIGLNNARERLKLLFGERSKLRISNRDESSVEAIFNVPLKSE